MSRSRRAFLASLAAVGGLAGCLTSGSNVTYPSTTADGANTTATTRTTTAANATTTTRTTETTEPTETTTETTETTETTTSTPVPTANPRLATETGRVFEGIVWFATEYEDAVEAYQRAVGRVRTVVGQLRNSDRVTSNDLRRLSASLSALDEVVEEHIAPRFPVDERLTDPENVYMTNVRRFSRRGDADRTQAELDEMFQFYLSAGLDRYVATEFSVDPVRDALFEYLAVEEHPRRPLFELAYPPAGFTTYGYRGESLSIVGDPVDDEDRLRLRGDFSGVTVEDGRQDYAYVVSNVRRPGFSGQRTDVLTSQPVYLQRYRSASAAVDALELMREGPVVQEGRQSLAERPWRRVFYYHEGDITYAYLVRAGQYLLAVAPSRTAWEERPENWHLPLELTWLWNTPG